MIDDNKLKKIYSTLQQGGYSQDFDSFKKGFTGNNNYSNRKQVYDLLSANGAQIGNTYKEFMDSIQKPKAGKTPMTAEDRARFSAGAKAISASAQQTMNNAGRYNKLKQQKQKQQSDFGRVNLGTKRTPFAKEDNVVKDDFAYNPTTGETGTYVTSDNQETDNLYEAQGKQAALDEYNKEYQNAVDTGEIASVFDVRDKDGNYDLQENIGKDGAYLTEEGAQNQLERKLDDAYVRKKEIEDAIAKDNQENGNPLLSYSGSIGAGNGRNAENSDYRNKLATSLSLVKQQIGALEAVKQYPTSSWVEDAWKALDNTAFTAKTWDFGLTDFAVMGQMERIKAKMDNKIPLTDSDKMLLKSKLGSDAAAALEDEKMGNIYRWTKIAGQSLPFMLDFFLTGGYSGAAKTLGTAALKYAAKRGMGTLGKNVLKYTGVTVGNVVSSYAMAGTEQAFKTGADIMQRHLGTLYQDENGNYGFGTFDENGNLLHDGGESIGSALYKGLTSAMVENYTEKFFHHTHFKRFLGQKMAGTKLGTWLSKVGTKGWYANSKNIMKKFGIDGFGEEVMEEEIGIPLHALLDGDNKMSDLVDAKQQLDIVGGMALSVGSMALATGGGSAAAKSAYRRGQYYRFKHLVDVSDNEAQQLFTDDAWEKLKEQIDNTTNEKMGGMLYSVLQSKNTMSKEQIDAAVKYGVNLMKMRGYNLASTMQMQARETTNEPTTPEEEREQNLDDAYSEGHNAEGADTHTIQLEQNESATALAGLLGITEEKLHNMSDDELDAMTGQNDQLDEAIYDYQMSTARYQGVMDNANDKVDMAARRAAIGVDQTTDLSRGSVRNATIKATKGEKDYGVYIISGHIATNEDGTINIADSDKMILYYDPKTRRKDYADASRFASLGEEVPADQVKAQAVADAKEKAIKEVSGIIDGRVEEGSEFTVTDEQGNEHTYEVLADNGDGTAMITIDGNVEYNPYSLNDLQLMKDAEDKKRLEAAKAEREQYEQAREQQKKEKEQAQVQDDEQLRAQYNNLLDNDGKVVMGTVHDGKHDDLQAFIIGVNQSNKKPYVVFLNEDGSFTKPRTFKADQVERGESVDYETFKAMMPSATEEESSTVEEDRGEEESLGDELPPVPDNVTINGDGTYSVDGERQGEQETSEAPSITLSDGTIVPIKEDGNPDFSQLTAEQTAELYDTQFGDDADQVINGWVEDAKKALDKATNMTVKGKNFVEQKASKEAKDKAIADAQAAYDSASAIRDAYKERQIAQEENTAEGRKNLIEKARRKYNRLKVSVKDNAQATLQLYQDTVGSLLHRLYDGTGIDVFDDTPNTVDEYVASSVAPYSLNYEGNENSKGVQQETGLSRSDFAKLGWLAANGKGTTVDAMVHKLWDNRPSNLENVGTLEIRSALLNLITSGQTAFESRNYIQNNRIAQAENILEEQERAAAESETENTPSENTIQPAGTSVENNTEVPADATDEKPLGEQQDSAPFSARKNAEEGILTNREEYVENNRVENIKTVDYIVGKKMRKTLERIAKMMGAKIQWQYSDKTGNGWYDANTNTIYLALDSSITEGVQFIFGHEVTHEIKSKNPEAYEELRGLVKEMMGEDSFDSMTDATQKRYNDARIFYIEGRPAYEEEVVADQMGHWLQDANYAHTLAMKMSHPLLAKLHEIVNRIKMAFTGTEYTDNAKIILRSIEQAYVKTANGTFESPDTGVRHSLKEANERFNNEIENFKNKSHKGLMHLGAPSPILKACGVNADEITLSPKVLNKKLNQHSLTSDDAKDLVNAIQKPIMVYKHGEKSPNIVVVTNANVRGNKLSLALELDTDGNVREMNNVSSIHDKDAETEVKRWLSWDEGYLENALRWVDKEKVSDWLSSARLNSYSQTEYNQKLSSLAKVLNNFENPKVSEENLHDDVEKVQYSLRQKPEPTKKGIGYKVFVLKDGKLYPPMVANPNGAETPVGVWLDADAAPIAGESKTGRPQVKQGGKGTQGGSGKLAYRPGWHLGVIPYALQFNRKDAEGNKTLFPANFVFAEVEYAADKDYQDEAHAEGVNENGKYQHSLAGLKHLPTDGYYMYRTNPNPETDPWVITGAMKVNRILTRTEQAELVKNAGREPQIIQDGDIVTDDVVNTINQQIANAPKFSLKVYHGSGADFTEFDFKHMGEGAGSQAFGWGGYVTSSKKIGKDYANIKYDPDKDVEYVGKNKKPFTDLIATLFDGGIRDYDYVKNTLQEISDKDKSNISKKEEYDWFVSTKPEDWFNPNPKTNRNLYEVNIPDDNGKNYLGWDEPLTDEQRKIIYNGLVAKNIKSPDLIVNAKMNIGTKLVPKFRAVYDLLSTAYNLGGIQNASQFLSSLGFTGIKYKAGTIMGGAEEGDVNYVIFKPEDMQIAEHTKFSLKGNVDNQGNPLNADGTLKLDKIKSVADLTDKDFTNATRNVLLPAVPKNVDSAIGANGKPVIIKKNIFQKNWNAHKFIPAESRKVLNDALYNTDLVGRSQPTKKPNHWVAIKLDEKSPITVLEVNDNKDNVEIVGWYTLDERNLGRIKRQAERNGGELIMLSPIDKVESLSTPSLNSAAKIDNSSETAKENGEKVDSEDPKTFDEFLEHPSMKFSIKNEEQRKAAENAYNWAAENRPDKYNQYAIVDMDEPNRMPEYFEKKALAEQWRKYYTNKWKIGNYKAFDLDKPFEEQVKNVKGNVPDEFDPHKKDAAQDQKIAIQKQLAEAEKQLDAIYEMRKNRQKQLLRQYMDKNLLSSTSDVPDKALAEIRLIAVKEYRPAIQELFDKCVNLDNQLQTMEAAESDVKFSLKEVNDKFNDRLEELIKNPNQKDKILRLGHASTFLQDGGIADADIELEFDKFVRKSDEDYKNQHPFDADDLKNMPLALAEPIAVFESTNANDHVVLTELQKDGKNFIVAIRTVSQNRKGGVVLEVNQITSLYPKKERGIVHWINTGRISNVNEEKALHFIEALQPHAGTTITSEELETAAKVIKDYESSKENAEKSSMSIEESIEDFASRYGVDMLHVATYADAMKRKDVHTANWAMASMRVALRHKNSNLKLSEFKNVLKPIQEELYARFGNMDDLQKQYEQQVAAERNVMEAARKKAEEEENKHQKHLEELAQLSDAEIDKKYMDSLEKGDESMAREMLDESARRKGYGDANSDYQGVGAWAAPSNPGYETDEERRADVADNAPDVNLEDMALGYSKQPDDYFENPRAYGQDTTHGLESTKAIKTALDALKRGEKDVKVKVYRAVPTSIKEGKLHNGDWVTPSKTYADMHGNSRLEGKYRIIEDEVPANQLWWDGNDANEFGFDDGKEYKYKNAKNNRKLNDLVTRDDKGNIIPPSKRFNSRKSDIRFSIGGVRGAANLDKAEEVTTRLDNLNVARQMEEAKKDAKTIKVATGWERGADGKWRYEMPDAKMKDTIDIGGKIVKRSEDDMLWTGGKLGEYVDAPDLFKAYPQLKDVRLDTDEIVNDMPSNGAYDPNTNTITIHATEVKFLNSILNHEIQHAIQYIEGFATGGNEEMFLDKERIAKMEQRKAEIEQEIANGNYENEEELQEVETELFDLTEDSPYHQYRSLAGEVEARNVQKRLGMTDEERRNSLAAETEDVAREDQIFLFDEGGENHMGSRTNKNMAKIGKYFDGRNMSDSNQVIVDVFSGKRDKQTVAFTDKDGHKHHMFFFQGHELKAGSKHAIYRHYGEKEGWFNEEEITKVHDALILGNRFEDNGMIEYTYKDKSNGIEYTVAAEKDGTKERFITFYTNRKAPKSSLQNTQQGAQADVDAFQGAKVSNSSETTKENAEKFSLKDAKEDRIQKLRESKPVEISGKEITPSDDLKQYKKNALEFGKTLRGTYTNEDTGEVIDLTGGNKRGGIRELLQHDYKDIEHLQSIAAIPQIIQKSVFIDELPNEDKQHYPDVKSFRYYVCGLKIDSKDYTVKAVVAEQNNGNRYYDHRLTDIEKGKLLSIIPTIQKAGIDGNLPDSVYKDKRLISILQTNRQKIVEEVKNTANQLGGAEVTTYTNASEVPEEYKEAVNKGAKGWYDPSTHTVHVYLPNCADANEAQRTVFHEKIGHEGMEILLGGEEGLRKFANFVYRSVGKAIRSKILDFANKYDPDWKNPDRMNVGAQEYMAHLAEEGPKTAEDFSLWTKIKHYLIKALKKLGIRIPGLLNDKDLRYYLMKAGKSLHTWDEMPKEKQEAMMQQATNADIKNALGDMKGKPRQKKGESAIQFMKRMAEWKKWQKAHEDKEDPEPPMFYDFDKDEAGKKEWEKLNKDWRDRHGLEGEEPTSMPTRKEGETDDEYMTRIHNYEKWQNACKDKADPMPDMFAFEKEKQAAVKEQYENWLTRHELNEESNADLDLYEGKIYPAETNPEADEADRQFMQDLADVTSTDVSSEGAARSVKYATIRRRKNMEEASADDAIYINEVKRNIEEIANGGLLDNLLSEYKGTSSKAEKLAEAIPYIIEAPRRIREIAYKLNSTGVFGEGHIHITPDDVEAIQELRPELAKLAAKKHTEIKNGEEVELFDDMQGTTEMASKMANIINSNHSNEPGFVPIDGTDILNKNVLPVILKPITPWGVDYKELSEPLKSVIDAIRDWYNYTFDWLKDNNTLKADTGFTVDYVNHLWDKEKSDAKAYSEFVENRQRTKSPNEKPREINTLMEGIEAGLVPKTTDITKMMAYYSRSNIEAWANKTMLQEVSGLTVVERDDKGDIISSNPVLSSEPPLNLEQYDYYEIPGVGPVWVYSVSPKQVKVKNPITSKDKVLYSEASAGSRFGVVFDTYQSAPFWKGFDTLASSAKKLELGFSGFHAGALTEVYMVQNMIEFGPKKALGYFLKYIMGDTMKNHRLPCFANPEDFQEAAAHLVKFGATNDYAAADVQDMYDNFRNAMQGIEKRLRGNLAQKAVGTATLPLKIASEFAALANKGMDVALWDFLHDGLKLATYRLRSERTKRRAAKEGWTQTQLDMALDEDGQFVNDMFGGQHWDVLGASTKTLRRAGRALLSPDWNISTTRHFLAVTGFGSIWNEATAKDFKNYYEHVWSAARGKSKMTPDDWGRLSRQKSAILCYGLGFMVFYEALANAANAAFRAIDEEKERKKAEEIRKTNPDYKSPYELAYPDGMKWYDYLMRGNTLGQQSKIFVGRYADGTEMYIRHGKQFREVPEYLFNSKGELEFPGPMVQRMQGKANPMVRMMLDNINYLSDFQASHADQELQRKYGKTIGLLYKDALYWAPFLIPSQENKEFKAVDFFFPSSKGFSSWKAQDYFKNFILSGDMEGVMKTYQSCQRNGIDAEKQLQAAITSIKALESQEMQDGVTSLQVATQRFDEAKSVTEKRKMREKMRKFLSLGEYKAFTMQQATDMVKAFQEGEDVKEMKKADDKYLGVATSADVTEDWRIQQVRASTKTYADKLSELKGENKAKAGAFKNAHARVFKARKAITQATTKMNKLKKKLGDGNDKATLNQIRDIRKKLLKELAGMEHLKKYEE